MAGFARFVHSCANACVPGGVRSQRSAAQPAPEPGPEPAAQRAPGAARLNAFPEGNGLFPDLRFPAPERCRRAS